MDFWIRVGLILALGAGAFYVLKRIDPLGGKDYSGVPPKAKRTIVIGAAVIAALLLLLKSGEPSSLDECQAEAAKMPTEAGVRLAANRCFKRFAPRSP